MLHHSIFHIACSWTDILSCSFFYWCYRIVQSTNAHMKIFALVKPTDVMAEKNVAMVMMNTVVNVSFGIFILIEAQVNFSSPCRSRSSMWSWWVPMWRPSLLTECQEMWSSTRLSRWFRWAWLPWVFQSTLNHFEFLNSNHQFEAPQH